MADIGAYFRAAEPQPEGSPVQEELARAKRELAQLTYDKDIRQHNTQEAPLGTVAEEAAAVAAAEAALAALLRRQRLGLPVGATDAKCAAKENEKEELDAAGPWWVAASRKPDKFWRDAVSNLERAPEVWRDEQRRRLGSVDHMREARCTDLMRAAEPAPAGGTGGAPEPWWVVASRRPESFWQRAVLAMPADTPQADGLRATGGTQLYFAAMTDNLVEMTRLLDSGVSASSIHDEEQEWETDDGQMVRCRCTVLLSALSSGCNDAARLLLKRKANPNLACELVEGGPHRFLDTPLMVAAQDGDFAMVALLLAGGADCNAVRGADGWTAFHDACSGGCIKCVERLYIAGCNGTAKTATGLTGWQMAAEGVWKGHEQVAELPVLLLNEASAAGQSEMVGLLLDRGASPNGFANQRGATVSEKERQTPLMAAVSQTLSGKKIASVVGTKRAVACRCGLCCRFCFFLTLR